MNNKIQQNANQHPSPELIERFLQVQEKELIVRNQEIELRKQNDSNAFEYSKAALEANAKDRESERKHQAITIKHRYFFAGIIISFFFILLGFTLYLGKDQIVFDIIKTIGSLAIGGLGGYYYSEVKKPKNNN